MVLLEVVSLTRGIPHPRHDNVTPLDTETEGDRKPNLSQMVIGLMEDTSQTVINLMGRDIKATVMVTKVTAVVTEVMERE